MEFSSSRKTATLAFQRRWLAPAFWPVWLLLATMWVLAHLPYRLQMVLGAGLGKLLYWLAHDRRKIARANVRQAFPDLSTSAQKALIKSIFTETGKGLPEICVAWFGHPEQLNIDWQVEGLATAQNAASDPRGALLVGAHFSCIDICGIYLSSVLDFDTLQRPNNNKLLNYFQYRGRLRYAKQLIDRRDMRQMVRSLRQGRAIFYAPDQDLGRKRSVFVPFFNIPTATVTATSKLVSLTGAQVILVLTTRTRTGYRITFEAAPQLASGDVEQDLAGYNTWLEARIRETPAQYLWLHKRFKTRPEGEPSFYGIKGK